MSYQINLISRINGVVQTPEDITSQVLNGFSLIEKLDDALDIGQIILRGSTISSPLTLFDTIEIEYNSTLVGSYRISGDTVSLISKKPKLYEHNISLVEHTKIAELFYISGKTFRQPTDGTIRYYLQDVIEILFNTVPYELNSVYGGNRLFETTQDIDLFNFLSDFPSPEFTFKNATLRECLKQICDVVDGIPRFFLNSSNELEFTIDFVNDLKTLITSNDEFIGETITQDNNFYAKEFESDALNLVNDTLYSESAEIYPSRETYANYRQKDEFLQANFEGSVLVLPKRIYTVPMIRTKTVLYLENVTNTDILVNNQSVEMDFTLGILESKDYQTLEFGSPEALTLYPATEQENEKSNSIYFDYRDKYIYIGETYSVFGTQEIVEQWYARNVIQYYKDTGLIDGSTNKYTDDYSISFSSPEDMLLQVHYVPIPSSMRINIERQDINDVNKFSTLLSNQQDRIINLENFANNLQGKVNRVGNSELELSNRDTSPFNGFDIGDYTDELYIITEKETVFYKDYCSFNYKLSKNFNKISSFIGVNSEIRQWEIGEQDTLIRNLLYKEYIEIDALTIGNGSDDSEILTSDGIECYLDTFDTSSTKKAVSTSVLKTDGTDTYNLASISSNGGGNSLIFNFKMDDNKSSGFYREEVNSQETKQFSDYTDEDGLFDTMRLYVMDTLIGESVLISQNFADAYPKIVTRSLDTDETDRFGTVYIDGTWYVKKDSGEILSKTLQFAQLSKDQDKVILGRYLSMKNRLVSEAPPTTIKLYTYNDGTKFGRTDTSYIKEGYDTVQTASIVISSTYNKITITNSALTSDKSSWALTDEDDRILIAVNQDGEKLDTITFDFNNKRSGINYKY